MGHYRSVAVTQNPRLHSLKARKVWEECRCLSGAKARPQPSHPWPTEHHGQHHQFPNRFALANLFFRTQNLTFAHVLKEERSVPEGGVVVPGVLLMLTHPGWGPEQCPWRCRMHLVCCFLQGNKLLMLTEMAHSSVNEVLLPDRSQPNETITLKTKHHTESLPKGACFQPLCEPM